MKKFINLHQHTDLSNAITIPEVVNRSTDYIKYAVDNDLGAVAFTEHGSVLSWTSKKQKANASKLKYIHGIEFYLTENLKEKKRDNYHLIMLAKNYDGVKEINVLSSKSFKGRGAGVEEGEDNNFYYNPRISFDDVFNTSDNIIILTGCLGSPLWQLHRTNNDKINDWIDFIVKNKHRVWLELQPHDDGEQKQYNKMLLELAEKHGLNIVATNDVHALTEEDDKLRKILMKSKSNADFEEENDNLELWVKDYDEMFETFKKQGVLTDEQIELALDNTLVIADMVEDFEFDLSFKYPKIFSDSEKRFLQLIAKGIKREGIDKFTGEKKKIYKERVEKEFAIYKSMKSIDYMLLMEYIMSSANDLGVYAGYARGSVSGSLIAYLLGITAIDPVKEALSFERFMNPARVNLSDIDSDFAGYGEESDRKKVTDFIINNDKWYSSSIVTYNTLGLKSAIKDIGRALGYAPTVTNSITKQIDAYNNIPKAVEEQYQELIDIAKKVVGTVISIGRHAGGFVVTTDNIEEEMGTIEVSKSDYPVSSIAMKEVESRFYVKLDILGLDNIGLINDTCKLLNIDRITPLSNIDFNDKDVMNDIKHSTVGIFQYEGERAQELVRTMFSEQTQSKMEQIGVSTSPIDQLAFLNAAMRPGASSIVQDIINGNAKDNGHKALNELLQDTSQMLVYQEQQIEFLVRFCGRSASEADLVRRAIGHKEPEVLAVEIPKIREEFIKTMVEKYDDTEEHAREIIEPFLKIFQDAADYSFSKNHAIPYSYIGYISAWLRYYYPLEFLTVAFRIWFDDLEKIQALTEYAKYRGINIKGLQYGLSKGDYFYDKETNSIYEGTSSIKGMNAKVGDWLYDVSKTKKYENFLEFLLDTHDKFSIQLESKQLSNIEVFNLSADEIKEIDTKIKSGEITITKDELMTPNSSQMLSLIRVGYFAEYGTDKYLEQVYELFKSKYKKTNKTMKSKANNYNIVKDEIEKLDETSTHSIYDKARFELDYLSKCTVKDDRIPPQYVIVVAIPHISKQFVKVEIHSINKGKTVEAKLSPKEYRNVPIEVGDVVEIVESKVVPKNVYVDNTWQKSETEKELVLSHIKYIRKGSKK